MKLESIFKLRGKGTTAAKQTSVEVTPGGNKITLPTLPEGYSWAVVPVQGYYRGRGSGVIDGDSDRVTHDVILKGPSPEGEEILYRESILLEREIKDNKTSYYSTTHYNFDVTPESIAKTAKKIATKFNEKLAKDAAKVEAARKKEAALAAAKALEGDYSGGQPLA